LECFKELVGFYAFYLFRGLLENMERIGLGTGSTVKYFIKLFIKNDLYRGRELFVSSLDTYYFLRRYGVESYTVNELGNDLLDFYIDGFDEASINLDLVKGRGGAFNWEKKLASRSKLRIYIGDYTKFNNRTYLYLKLVPIEVKPDFLEEVVERVSKLGFQPKIRYGKVRDGPVLTDGGNYIVDLKLNIIGEPKKIDQVLKGIKGVVETGVFPNELVDHLLISGPFPGLVKIYSRRGFRE